jgi:hypothetical protein
MEQALRLLVLLVAAVEPLGGVEQRFAMEPQDQTAIVGSRVTLPCRVINKTGVLQWTKDDFGLGTHRNLSGFDRYAMIGSDEEGQCVMQCHSIHTSNFKCVQIAGARVKSCKYKNYNRSKIAALQPICHITFNLAKLITSALTSCVNYVITLL